MSGWGFVVAHSSAKNAERRGNRHSVRIHPPESDSSILSSPTSRIVGSGRFLYEREVRKRLKKLAYKRTIVCLANSRKLQGRCVAGLELSETTLGSWIRPVSSSEKGELSAERFYPNWKEPELLDIIEIEFLRPRTAAGHCEDHFVNGARKWLLKGSFGRKHLKSAIEQVRGCLWFDGGSTSNGENDKIPLEAAAKLRSSLKLVQPNELTMWVQIEGASFGKARKKVRGRFSLAGVDYVFAVTDSFIEREFKDAPEGTERTIASPMLCLSVSEVFEKQNACYKLIAGVLE